MCGIAGAVNFSLSYSTIKKAMGHRGPDEQNGFTRDNIDFYHLRLSILDIAGGKQPMQLNDRFTIVFNGEIYNHQQIRKELGLHCQTSSDTETLLVLYQKFGSECLHYLEGMFAFAIYDSQEKKIFIARDRAGKKPLYCYQDQSKIVFASELNCLKALLPLQINEDNFYHYFRLGSFYKDCTPYKNVKELQGGSYLLIDCQTLHVEEKTWWSINQYYNKKSNDSFQESLEKVDNYLTTAVKRRVESSDLEVGSFLSGGIDSGLVTAIASKFKNQIKTFTVSFAGEYNEALLAKLVAEKYNTDHTEINISFDNLKNDVEKIISNYGEPFFDSSAIPSYYVSAAAKKHVTVILNGDGADELFGGYRRYVPFAKYDFFSSGAAIRAVANLAKKAMPLPHNKKSIYNYLQRLISLASKDGVEIYLSAGVDIMEDWENQILAKPSSYLKALNIDFDAIVNQNISGLQKIMNVDFNTNLFSDLLVKMDIATMANSIEGRSPFLCKELLAYVPGLDDSFKIKNGTTKYLLRQLAKKYLPSELINQPKRGFEIPLKKWVDGELNEIVNDYVGSASGYCKNFINPTFIQSLLNNSVNVPAEKRAKMLWTFLSAEIWYRKVYLC